MIEQLQLLLDAARWRAQQAEEDFENPRFYSWVTRTGALVEALELALHAANEYQQAKEQTE